MADKLLDYQTQIQNFREPTKPIVNSLTKQAGALFNPYGPNIVEFICDQIVHTKPSRRIALFYLVDSIIKNVKPYGSAFEQRLHQVFIRCFQEATDPKHIETYKKLHRLWKGYLSEVTLRDLQSFIDSFSPAQEAHTQLPAPPAKRARVDDYDSISSATSGGYGGDYSQPSQPAYATSYSYDYDYADPAPVDVAALGDLSSALDLAALGSLVSARQGFAVSSAEPEGAHAAAVAAARASVRADDDAVDLSWAWLRHPRVAGVRAITTGLAAQCCTCGLRLPDAALVPAHMKVHFDLNMAGKASTARRWYRCAEAWATHTDVLGAGPEPARAEAAEVAPAAESAAAAHSLPVDPAQLPEPCRVCAEPFAAVFDDEEDDWVLRGAIRFDRAQLLEHMRAHLEAAGERFDPAAVLRDLSVDAGELAGRVLHWTCYTQLLRHTPPTQPPTQPER